MEIPHRSRAGRWKAVAAAALAVAAVAVAVAVAVPTALCRPPAGSAGDGNSLEKLEKALDGSERALARARGQWEGCREELGALQGKALELERALANVTRLEEENGALRTALALQQEQLEEQQSHGEQLQQQNRLLQDQLRDMRSQNSAGNTPGTLPALGVLALLLLGMLLP